MVANDNKNISRSSCPGPQKTPRYGFKVNGLLLRKILAYLHSTKFECKNTASKLTWEEQANSMGMRKSVHDKSFKIFCNPFGCGGKFLNWSIMCDLSPS